MQLSDYTSDLPEELIASEPPKVRGAARLLYLNRKTGEIQDKNYGDIVDLLNSGDVLVLNDTKVIKARLKTKKAIGVEREIVILEKHGFDSDWHSHRVMYRGKIRAGDELFVEDVLLKVVEVLGDGLAIVESKHDLLDLTEKYGTVPLPPYMQ